jgi:hypothetical protein
MDVNGHGCGLRHGHGDMDVDRNIKHEMQNLKKYGHV